MRIEMQPFRNEGMFYEVQGFKCSRLDGSLNVEPVILNRAEGDPFVPPRSHLDRHSVVFFPRTVNNQG
jgi:hypothetical protein